MEPVWNALMAATNVRTINIIPVRTIPGAAVRHVQRRPMVLRPAVNRVAAVNRAIIRVIPRFVVVRV